ncbi:hypothetical protein [Streptomyces sp. NBC_01092]|uniref:hypothetical protein n=1 Tax=Streptomyces sp. NBC_01092 TaxID=2903748 RepID=UPI003869E624|nr:hypothetical protein OG254_40525 [Streptomyces sp. NBC_01092]
MGDLGRDDPRWTPAASTPLTIEITIYGWSKAFGGHTQGEVPNLGADNEGQHRFRLENRV